MVIALSSNAQVPSRLMGPGAGQAQEKQVKDQHVIEIHPPIDSGLRASGDNGLGVSYDPLGIPLRYNVGEFLDMVKPYDQLIKKQIKEKRVYNDVFRRGTENFKHEIKEHPHLMVGKFLILGASSYGFYTLFFGIASCVILSLRSL